MSEQNCIFGVPLRVHEFSMDFEKPITTTPNTKVFRNNLKLYLDLAMHEAIRVQRRSGDNFIVIKETNYKALMSELIHLQRRLLKMAPIFHMGFMEEDVAEIPKKKDSTVWTRTRLKSVK
jgi:PHD/YefM family antitoxin component YafN of YafNO toxin-antitoxin module